MWTEQWQQWELPFPKGRAIPSSAGICATSHPHRSKSVQGDALPWPGHDCSLGSKENQTSITTTFGQDHPLGPALNHGNAELPTWDGTLAGGCLCPSPFSVWGQPWAQTSLFSALRHGLSKTSTDRDPTGFPPHSTVRGRKVSPHVQPEPVAQHLARQYRTTQVLPLPCLFQRLGTKC